VGDAPFPPKFALSDPFEHDDFDQYPLIVLLKVTHPFRNADFDRLLNGASAVTASEKGSIITNR